MARYDSDTDVDGNSNDTADETSEQQQSRSLNPEWVPSPARDPSSSPEPSSPEPSSPTRERSPSPESEQEYSDDGDDDIQYDADSAASRHVDRFADANTSERRQISQWRHQGYGTIQIEELLEARRTEYQEDYVDQEEDVVTSDDES